MGGLTRKLFLGFGGVIAVIVCVGVALIAFLTLQSQTLETVLRENYDSVVYCDRMEKSLNQALAIAQGRLFSPATQAMTTLVVSRWNFEADAQREVGNSTLPGELEKSRDILADGLACFQEIDRLSSISPATERAAFYQKSVFPKYQATRNLLGNVSQMNLENLAEVNGHVRISLLLIRNTVATFTIVGLTASILIVWITARRIIRPLIQLTASVRQIEGGNLDSVVNIESNDEIGHLAKAFNAMAATLREFRRLDHQRLFRTQQTTQAAIDSLPDAVAVLDPRGIIEIANRTARVHFGLEPGADMTTVQPGWAESFLRSVVESGRPHLPDGYRSAIQLFDESGERFLLPRAMPIIDMHYQLIGVTLVLVEVTHLRRADEFKSGLLATVSHELKTPLTSVRMAVRLLLDKRLGELNDRQTALLSNAKDASERLVRTMEDLLTMNRVEAGRARLDIALWSAQEIIQRAVSMVESVAAEREIGIHRKRSSEDIMIRVDVALISCALSNLLSNAVKFSPRSSSVAVSVSRTAELVEFAVSDEGPGIAEKFREVIFDKFFRIAVADGPSGAGLGLSIAKEIVQLHGGTIAVRSDAGKGSIFYFTLPNE
jgi:two-component system, NtrC family, sensor histidine kinase KinB